MPDPKTPEAAAKAAEEAAHRAAALVTGASSGLGEVFAEELARQGRDLVLTARRGEVLEELAGRWRATYGVAVTVIPADLSEPGAAEALAEAIRARGLALDTLINNAGYGRFGLFESSSLEEQLGMIRLNVEALTALTRLFLPDLVARRGRILNVASTAAFQPGPWLAVYYATKAFVLSFSEALAEELAPSGVTVTAFCPGPVATGFQARADLDRSSLLRRFPMPGAREVALEGIRAMQAGRRVAIAGRRNWLMALGVRFTPRRLVTRLVARLSRPIDPPAAP